MLCVFGDMSIHYLDIFGNWHRQTDEQQNIITIHADSVAVVI